MALSHDRHGLPRRFLAHWNLSHSMSRDITLGYLKPMVMCINEACLIIIYNITAYCISLQGDVPNGICKKTPHISSLYIFWFSVFLFLFFFFSFLCVLSLGSFWVSLTKELPWRWCYGDLAVLQHYITEQNLLNQSAIFISGMCFLIPEDLPSKAIWRIWPIKALWLIH